MKQNATGQAIEAMHTANPSNFNKPPTADPATRQPQKPNPLSNPFLNPHLNPPTIRLSTPEQINKKYRLDTFMKDTVASPIRVFELNPSVIIHYSTLHRAPLAVHELLTKNMLEGDAERDRSFHPDPTLKSKESDRKFVVDNSYYSDTQAYKNFNYTRGHMAMASNYDFNQEYKSSTFSFANTVPQEGNNNSGIWNTFERYCKTLLQTDKCETLQVISGPVYHDNVPHPDNIKNVYESKIVILKQDGIMAPPMLYKIIKCNTEGAQYASGFIFHNAKSEKNQDNQNLLSQYEIPLESLQSKTGLNFSFTSKVQSLSKVDPEGLKKNKRWYDEPFYRKIITRATKVGDVNQAMMRAYQQGIYIDPRDYHEKILKMATDQFSELNENRSNNVCSKLNNQMNLHKNLWYLKVEGPLMTKIQDSIYEKIIPCRQSNDTDMIRKISKKVLKSHKKYELPHSLFSQRVFSTWKQPLKTDQ